MSYFKNSVIQGTNDSGDRVDIPVTAEGHVEVALHAPRLPFSSVHTENILPIFQTDAVYGLNAGQVTSGSSGTGTATASNGMFVCSTGTTIYSQGYIQGRKRLRYRAGQGLVGRFAGYFTTGVANSYQVIGFGHAEDGVFFGYKNATFGIIHNVRGVREVQTLTVTTGATSSSNCTITLDGTANTVALTNASNIQRTVWEIANGTYSGWKAYPASSTTVVFVSDSVGNKSGTMSFSAGTTGAAATIAETVAGAAVTETFIPQSSWNGDKLDGTGASGVTLDPTKGNVYQIGIQYLGFGAIEFKVEVAGASQNNSDFVTVHTIKNPNTLTAPIFGNPSFPFSMATYSAGSTTNIEVKCASFAGFIEGQKQLHGNRFSYYNQLTTVGAVNYQALFTVLNSRYYKGRVNQAVINIQSISGALKHTSPTIFYLIRNGSLNGNPSFSQYATDSVSMVDNSATTVTFSTNDQIIWSGHLGDTGQLDHSFSDALDELTIQPGEWVTLAARAVTGSPSYVTGSLNTREDQ